MKENTKITRTEVTVEAFFKSLRDPHTIQCVKNFLGLYYAALYDGVMELKKSVLLKTFGQKNLDTFIEEVIQTKGPKNETQLGYMLLGKEARDAIKEPLEACKIETEKIDAFLSKFCIQE